MRVWLLLARRAVGCGLDRQTVVSTNGNCTPHETFFRRTSERQRRTRLYSRQHPILSRLCSSGRQSRERERVWPPVCRCVLSVFCPMSPCVATYHTLHRLRHSPLRGQRGVDCSTHQGANGRQHEQPAHAVIPVQHPHLPAVKPAPAPQALALLLGPPLLCRIASARRLTQHGIVLVVRTSKTTFSSSEQPLRLSPRIRHSLLPPPFPVAARWVQGLSFALLCR